MDNKRKNKFVIGGSSGSIAIIKKLLSELSPNFQGTIFIVIHLALDGSESPVAAMFNKCSALPVRVAQKGMEYRPGHVYVAPPNRHLLIDGKSLNLSVGPRENRARPAIDPLFRSAAVAFGAQAVGVILSGLLDDGSAGLAAVKDCGGTTIVQDPDDAEFGEMPLMALQNVIDIDHVLTGDELPRVISQLADSPIGFQPGIPRQIELEAQISKSGESSIEFEEHARVLKRLSEQNSERERNYAATAMNAKYEEAKKHAKELRKFLFTVQNNETPDVT